MAPPPGRSLTRQDSSGNVLKLASNQTVKVVGTLQEVMDASRAARMELLPFARSKLPHHVSLWGSLQFGALVFNFRHLVNLFKCSPRWDPLRPFTREIITLGGLERVQLLITIARFDINGDGSIDEAEFNSSRTSGEKCVANAVAGCANFAIISALLFGATHLTTIGRPIPWHPSPDTEEEFGPIKIHICMWTIYGLNVLAETLALSIIITSIFIRQLLCNALPSVISKLVFLSDTNVLANMATCATWVLAAIVWIVGLGGWLSVPTYGFLSAGILPLIAFLVVPSVYPAIMKTAIRLHFEACSIMAYELDPTLVREVPTVDPKMPPGPPLPKKEGDNDMDLEQMEDDEDGFEGI